MNKEEYYPALFILSVVILVIGGAILKYGNDTMVLKQEACKELGYAKFSTMENAFDHCKDNWGNVIFVDMDCDVGKLFNFFDETCSAHEIKVGQVWGVIKE